VTDRSDLVDALVQTSFTTMAVLTRVAADNDLSLTQLRVLAILRDRRVRMTDLAAYLGLEKSTMTGLVDRAEKRGLLLRAPNEHDRWAVDVFLSPEGAGLVDRVRPDVERSLAPMLDGLSPAHQHQLRTLMGRMLSRPVGGPASTG
jgi:DNA-binding MarR family transcriptional regulator